MKVLIILAHPTQFDVPVFRLGKDFIEVIYTEPEQLERVYDPELQRKVNWIGNCLEGYSYEVLPRNNKFFWLAKKIKNGRYDMIITNGYFSLSLIMSIFLGRIYCKRNSLRLDTVLFNNEGKLKKVTKFLTYSVLKIFINYYFVVGKLSKDFLISQRIDLNKIYLFGYISNDSFFKEELLFHKRNTIRLKKKYGVPDDKFIVVCVSKHNLREAPIDTILAFSKIDRENIHLLLVGDGPMHNEIKELAAKCNLKKVTFAGYVNYASLPEIYAISSLFVHDSHDEPWGVSVQEALSCGIPVVASNRVGSAYDLIIQGVNGYIFNAGDQAMLQTLIPKATQLDLNLVALESDEILKSWTYEVAIRNIKEAALSTPSSKRIK
jgi:glycosyltransferase involved in cell wall biosynthesis